MQFATILSVYLTDFCRYLFSRRICGMISGRKHPLHPSNPENVVSISIPLFNLGSPRSNSQSSDEPKGKVRKCVEIGGQRTHGDSTVEARVGIMDLKSITGDNISGKVSLPVYILNIASASTTWSISRVNITYFCLKMMSEWTLVSQKRVALPFLLTAVVRQK